MIPLYVFEIKIYHFSTSQFQFTQIINLEPIDSESNVWDPLFSADMAGSHMSGYLKNLNISKKGKILNISKKIKGIFYFHALGSLVVLSFPQLLSFFSVSPSPCLKPTQRARTEGIPFS
jgi:hypothetical protein